MSDAMDSCSIAGCHDSTAYGIKHLIKSTNQQQHNMSLETEDLAELDIEWQMKVMVRVYKSFDFKMWYFFLL